MKALQVEGIGAAPRLVEIATPDPGPGQVRLRVAACGLNFADLLMAEGRYQDTPEPPFVPGLEMAGLVDAVGPDVRSVAPGQRVAVFAGQGGLAECACVPEEACIAIPGGMTLTEAAAFQVAYGTSHLALSHRARLQPGETLVVLGAAGGVGLTAVEIGKAMGARVVAVARGPEKLEVARRVGADHLLDSETVDLREAVRELGGADVVYDPVGGAQFDAMLRACRPEARILTIGFASGTVPQIPANILLVKNLTVMGLYWGGYLRFNPDALRDSLASLFRMHADGRLHPHISRTFPLDRAAEALDFLRSRKSTGKVVVTMDEAAG